MQVHPNDKSYPIISWFGATLRVGALRTGEKGTGPLGKSLRYKRSAHCTSS